MNAAEKLTKNTRAKYHNQLHVSLLIVTALVITRASATLASAQTGKLNLHVTPKQTYVFVDDRTITEANKHRSLRLSVGEHKIELVNYGYTPITRTVSIEAGKTKLGNLVLAFNRRVDLTLNSTGQESTRHLSVQRGRFRESGRSQWS